MGPRRLTPEIDSHLTENQMTRLRVLVDSAFKRGMYALRTSVKNKHIRSFLRYSSYAKLRNLLRVEAAIRTGKIRDFGFPYMLTVEPTNRCNLQCPLCPTGKGIVGRAKQNLDLSAFYRLIDEIGRYVYMINFQNWGEPLLTKHVVSMIQYAHDKGICTTIASNGNYPPNLNRQLIESQLDFITIAVDGASQDTYQKYRVGGDLELVKHNLTELVSIRKKTGSALAVCRIAVPRFRAQQA